jgi:hypothetical protein
MLAQLCQTRNLRPGRRARFFHRHARRRMWRGPSRVGRRTGTHLDDIRDAVPLAEKLPDLLLIDFERQRDLMIVFSRFGVYHGQIERPPRSRIQNAHQRSLRIAIANMKTLHVQDLPVFQ